MKDVTAAILWQKNKVLITRRGPGEKLAGKWEFPGGKVEVGETPEESLQREILEELGVQVTVGKYFTESIYHYGHGSIRLLAYEVLYISGDFNLTVHDQIKWVSVADLATFDFAPADIEIINQLETQINDREAT